MEKHDTNPVDALFRDTLENQPIAPDASGWDTPSDAVWQNIRREINPTRIKNNSRFGKWGLVLSGALLAGLCVYFLLKPAPTPVITPAVAPTTEPTVQPELKPVPSTATVTDQNVSVQKSAKEVAPKVSSTKNAKKEETKPADQSVLPAPNSIDRNKHLDGSSPDPRFPNSAARNKYEKSRQENEAAMKKEKG